MSAQTEKAMEEAIAAHFADERGATMTSYFVVVKGKTLEDLDNGITRYLVASPDRAEYDQVLGLARFGVLEVERGFDEDEDEP